MKKSSIPLFIGAFLLPYVMIAVQYFFYKYGIALIVFMVTFQIISIIYNCFAAKRAVLYIILSFNLTACTVAAYIISISRYMQYVSADSETALVGKLETIIGGVFTVIMSLLVWFFIRKLRYKKDAYDELQDEKPKTLSVLSFVFLIISFLSSVALSIYFAFYYSTIEPDYNMEKLFYVFLVTVILLFVSSIVLSFVATSKGSSYPALAVNSRVASFAFLFSALLSLFLIPALAYRLSSIL